ncbi:MAG: TIGR04076 family protein [Anaerolineae bacterium]|nr:TIGR04076 family protein [Anaerolineae bacterium]
MMVSRWPTCKITVLKAMYNPEIAEEYRRPDVDKGPCKFFTAGQEFIVDYLAQKPEGFACEWAWDDIHKVILTLMLKGDFSTWMKDGNMFITCCTDGVKPVVFKIERLEQGREEA